MSRFDAFCAQDVEGDYARFSAKFLGRLVVDHEEELKGRKNSSA